VTSIDMFVVPIVLYWRSASIRVWGAYRWPGLTRPSRLKVAGARRIGLGRLTVPTLGLVLARGA
jgi:hypothetical protein